MTLKQKHLSLVSIYIYNVVWQVILEYHSHAEAALETKVDEENTEDDLNTETATDEEYTVADNDNTCKLSLNAYEM